jgi:hypothetical protein
MTHIHHVETVSQIPKFPRPYCEVQGNHFPAGAFGVKEPHQTAGLPEDSISRIPFQQRYPKGGVVEVFAHENHPVRLRRPPLQGRGIRSSLSPSGGGSNYHDC